MTRLLTLFLFLFIVFNTFGQQLSYEEVKQLEIVVPGRQNSQWAKNQPYVVMLSIDGFRHDYAEMYEATNILSVARNGVSTQSLIASFPTKTFPNHYTLVTGLYPGNHGLVSNEFYSREKDYWYKIRDKSAVQDGSWYGGVPLWTLAEQQGMLSANFFWVGSEAPIGGSLSTYSYQYNSGVSNQHRVQRILDWLQMPPEIRPHMILGYFSLVDDAGHRYGPEHVKTKEAVLRVDELVGQLTRGLKKLNLPVHIVLVSDHGMSTITNGMVLPEMVDLEDAKVSYSFPPMIYQSDSAKLERLYDQLLQIEGLYVYRQEQVPNYLHFSNADRIGDLVLMTDAPTIIMERPQVVSGGTHGFDPYVDRDMGAIFYGQGPMFKSGVEISPVENIHIYPLIAEILGLKITEPIDGKLEMMDYLLRKAEN